MATINQLTKQIATSKKRIEDYTKKVSMYKERITKACTKADLDINEITIKEIPCGRASIKQVNIPRETIDRIGWKAASSILNAYEYMIENTDKVAREQKNLTYLANELATLKSKADAEQKEYNNNLAISYNEAMREFKGVWFEKMVNWHTEHHAYVNAHKDEARAIYNRADKCRWYFKLRRKHYRLLYYLEAVCKRNAAVFTDDACKMDLTTYLTKVKKALEEKWEQGIKTLTKKSQAFGVDENNITISNVAMTEKGFEVYVTDGKPRRIYARVIWCAEYSIMVSPHTRYIVTEKKTK